MLKFIFLLLLSFRYKSAEDIETHALFLLPKTFHELQREFYLERYNLMFFYDSQ